LPVITECSITELVQKTPVHAVPDTRVRVSAAAPVFFGDTAFTEVYRTVSILVSGRVGAIIQVVIHLTVVRRPVDVNATTVMRTIVVVNKNRLVACYHMVGVETIDCEVVDPLNCAALG